MKRGEEKMEVHAAVAPDDGTLPIPTTVARQALHRPRVICTLSTPTGAHVSACAETRVS